MKKNNIRRAAVTNAPRANVRLALRSPSSPPLTSPSRPPPLAPPPSPQAEMMISGLGLTDFFDALVIGAECEKAKPHPDPYLEGLRRATTHTRKTPQFPPSYFALRRRSLTGAVDCVFLAGSLGSNRRRRSRLRTRRRGCRLPRRRASRRSGY